MKLAFKRSPRIHSQTPIDKMDGYDEQNTCSMWILGFSHHVWKPSPPHANDRPGTMGMWLASKICNVALATTSGMSRDAAKAIQAETRKYIQ